MPFWEIVFWIAVSLFSAQFLLVLHFLRQRGKEQRIDRPMINSISVIIPFHNEEKNILPLLKSLNSQEEWPAGVELIFVDDGSTDRTAALINEKLYKPFRLITLPHKSGKKKAIHAGVEKAGHDFIVTLDADVRLGQNYLASLLTLPGADLVIMPVTMTGNHFVARLASVEFSWLQLLTFGAGKPILSNGANLGFRKAAYLESHPHRTDLNIPSGDDIFLMQSFQASGKLIARFPHEDLTVETPAPATWQSLFRQRRRWVGKFAQMAETRSFLLGAFLAMLQVAFVMTLVGIVADPWFALPMGLKFMAELMASLTYRYAGYRDVFGTMIIHQLWYPVYLLLLLFPGQPDAKWHQSA